MWQRISGKIELKRKYGSDPDKNRRNDSLQFQFLLQLYH